MTLTVCAVCQESVPPRERPGNPRRYCSARCRTEAYRTRQAAEAGEPYPDAGMADASLLLRADLMDVTDAVLREGKAGRPEDQLTRALIEARTLAEHLSRLEAGLPKGLGWRASMLSQRINHAMTDLFESETT